MITIMLLNMPVRGCMLVGMPRPLSVTVTQPLPRSMSTLMRLAYPACTCKCDGKRYRSAYDGSYVNLKDRRCVSQVLTGLLTAARVHAPRKSGWRTPLAPGSEERCSTRRGTVDGLGVYNLSVGQMVAAACYKRRNKATTGYTLTLLTAK